MVLRARVEFRKPELQSLTGRSLFEAAVTNGWVSRSSVEKMPGLHRVAFKGHYAAGYLKEAPQVPAAHFIKEGGQWKFALWKVFEAANADMRRMAQESKLADNEFAMEMLRRISKYEVDPRILDGPID